MDHLYPTLQAFITEARRKVPKDHVDGRCIIEGDYERRYTEFIKQNPRLQVNYYSSPHSYFIHVQIPSIQSDTQELRVAYDVVFELFPGNDSIAKEATFKNYTVRVFSNCPAFAYKYAYVYHQTGLLITGLDDKYDDKILRGKPTRLNPEEIIGFDYTIYYAAIYLLNRPSSIRLSTARNYRKGDFKDLTKVVRDYYEILRIYNKQSKLSLRNVKNQLTLKVDKFKRHVFHEDKPERTTPTTKTVKTTKLTRAVKTTKVIKSSKSVKTTRRKR